ncbi:ABC transporter ATP-binding protein [Prauserella cavernicola]|uniref:Sn-glycerol-3-phosphate ABC transporter ATP-binding protein UgpC n=1 Tax=Prauserella cavernicola TaxID=2800127 RepID=A0A934QSL0_9PSEU|nr:sn-glycerol-3-phosphate ABC transporter ATP-binding protein UgpC [Prauserella cavernicola]MBK1787477.1 sn-glycerol-3-phosphate ABC transporter ATP-binding protein UgpC [Prauserella cavernicola]
MAEVQYDSASRIFSGGSEVRAVDALDLRVADGEFLVLVGPSGSGKSTALRMLAGLEGCDEGRILIGGDDVTAVHPKDRDIAMVFQNYALYPHMTVGENMGFALRLRRTGKDEIQRRVADAAAMLDLTTYLDRKPKALSGGQRQRVAMGRAIVREPSVFLMDEPLSNLDAKLRVETRANIAALQRRLATTTVYVTHDQVEAMTMGDRVAVLRDGILQQCAAPRELYDRPVNSFVAGFIGSPAMNLVAATVTDGIEIAGTTLRIPASALGSVTQAGTPVLAGIRPEALRLVGDADEGIDMRVVLCEELGSDTYVIGDVGADGASHRITARVPAGVRAEPGRTLRLGLSESAAVHLFDPDTGDRLN